MNALLSGGTRDHAMLLTDVRNCITFWNAGSERLFGWTQEEAIGRSAEMLFTLEDLAAGAATAEMEAALRDGSSSEARWHVRKDGSRFWSDGVLLRLDPTPGSELLGFAKIARDATHQRQMEDRLRSAHDQLEQRVAERTAELLATNKELERTIAERQQLEKELLEISEREKRRIGEDLHDSICQELTATAFLLKSAATKTESESRAAAETLRELAQVVNRNVHLARELARGLQPVELTPAALNTALRAVAARASENGNMNCQFKRARGVRVQTDMMALHLYRIAQEAVTNAVKHSGASNVVISLERYGQKVCLRVADDGKGMPARRRRKGLGLHLMKYRANVLGGTLSVESGRRGTIITARIPVRG